MSGEAQTLNNNLDEAVTVNLDASVTSPTVSDEVSTTDSSAYNAEYVVLKNGETFANREPNSTGTEPVSEDKASTSYVYTGSQTGVQATYTSDAGHVHSGLWFNVTPTPADKAVIDPEVTSGSNDWIYAVVEYEGTPYVVGDFTSSSSYAFTDASTSHSYTVQDSSGTQITDISQIDSRNDFEKDKSDSNALPSDVSWSQVTVHYAVAGTGTQDGGANSDESGELTYTDFKFGDGDGDDPESLIKSVTPTATSETFEVASGDHELGFAADFKIDAYPGDYTFDLSVKP